MISSPNRSARGTKPVRLVVLHTAALLPRCSPFARPKAVADPALTDASLGDHQTLGGPWVPMDAVGLDVRSGRRSATTNSHSVSHASTTHATSTMPDVGVRIAELVPIDADFRTGKIRHRVPAAQGVVFTGCRFEVDGVDAPSMRAHLAKLAATRVVTKVIDLPTVRDRTYQCRVGQDVPSNVASLVPVCRVSAPQCARPQPTASLNVGLYERPEALSKALISDNCVRHTVMLSVRGDCVQ